MRMIPLPLAHARLVDTRPRRGDRAPMPSAHESVKPGAWCAARYASASAHDVVGRAATRRTGAAARGRRRRRGRRGARRGRRRGRDARRGRRHGGRHGVGVTCSPSTSTRRAPAAGGPIVRRCPVEPAGDQRPARRRAPRARPARGWSAPARGVGRAPRPVLGSPPQPASGGVLRPDLRRRTRPMDHFGQVRAAAGAVGTPGHHRTGAVSRPGEVAEEPDDGLDPPVGRDGHDVGAGDRDGAVGRHRAPSRSGRSVWWASTPLVRRNVCAG